MRSLRVKLTFLFSEAELTAGCERMNTRVWIALIAFYRLTLNVSFCSSLSWSRTWRFRERQLRVSPVASKNKNKGEIVEQHANG